MHVKYPKSDITAFESVPRFRFTVIFRPADARDHSRPFSAQTLLTKTQLHRITTEVPLHGNISKRDERKVNAQLNADKIILMSVLIS